MPTATAATAGYRVPLRGISNINTTGVQDLHVQGCLEPKAASPEKLQGIGVQILHVQSLWVTDRQKWRPLAFGIHQFGGIASETWISRRRRALFVGQIACGRRVMELEFKCQSNSAPLMQPKCTHPDLHRLAHRQQHPLRGAVGPTVGAEADTATGV